MISPAALVYVVKNRLTQPYDTRRMTYGPGCIVYIAYDAQSAAEYNILITGSPKYPHSDGMSE